MLRRWGKSLEDVWGRNLLHRKTIVFFFFSCNVEWTARWTGWLELRGGSKKSVRRLLKKMMVIAASKIIKNDGILDVFWTRFANGCRTLRRESRIMTNLATEWMDLSFLIWRWLLEEEFREENWKFDFGFVKFEISWSSCIECGVLRLEIQI